MRKRQNRENLVGVGVEWDVVCRMMSVIERDTGQCSRGGRVFEELRRKWETGDRFREREVGCERIW